jgi:urease accessory protein
MRGETLLAVFQLNDSSLPTGRYTLSHGLEAYVDEGLLSTPSAPDVLAALLRDCIRFGVATSDGVALACAHGCIGRDGGMHLGRVVAADQRLSAVKLPRELREASSKTGRALLAAAPMAAGVDLSGYAQLVEGEETPGNHAIVLGLLAALIGVPRFVAVAGELSAFCTGWVAAAVRLGLTDHLTAQLVLRHVRPAVSTAAKRAELGSVADISSSTPLLDVMAMRHEQAELRLFST